MEVSLCLTHISKVLTMDPIFNPCHLITCFHLRTIIILMWVTFLLSYSTYIIQHLQIKFGKTRPHQKLVLTLSSTPSQKVSAYNPQNKKYVRKIHTITCPSVIFSSSTSFHRVSSNRLQQYSWVTANHLYLWSRLFENWDSRPVIFLFIKCFPPTLK